MTARGLQLAFLLLFPLYANSSYGQQIGERVYAGAADSTFLLEVSDSSGAQTGTATGFLVANNKLLTNAHVADAGTISVRMGSLLVGCEVTRVDPVNDLAICEMSARSSAAPIKLAESEPKPGATVFALGNPRGLDKTISQGLFTGFRDVDGHRVAQISAAISPGSSGGPILNSDGEVIGVAVSSLTNGQTLNFAVPLSVVRDFLANRASATDARSLVDAAKALTSQRDKVGYDEPRWKELDDQIGISLTQAIAATNDTAVLSDAREAAGFGHFAIQASAARKTIQLTKSPTKDMFVNLATALYYSTDDNGPSAPLEEAEQAADRAVSMGRSLIAADLALLAGIQGQAGKTQQALATLLKASAVAESGSSEAAGIFVSLFRTSDDLGKPADAENWFKKSAAIAEPSFLDLRAYATFLERQKRYADAASVRMRLLQKLPTAYSDVCSAGRDYWMVDNFDEALSAGRRCLELAGPKNASIELKNSHHRISDILFQRGVYDDAAAHAREAIAIDPSDAWGHYYFAQALVAQRRFTEAISSAKTAIRLSDGKYSWFHFTLGNAYFSLKQWPEAVQSYLKAAEMDPTDSAAASNVAASYYNEKYYSDALKWYRETLRRNPNDPDKAEILKTITELSNR